MNHLEALEIIISWAAVVGHFTHVLWRYKKGIHLVIHKKIISKVYRGDKKLNELKKLHSLTLQSLKISNVVIIEGL